MRGGGQVMSHAWIRRHHRAFDAIVVGAGIVGAATARELLQTGRRVLVLEKAGAVGIAQTGNNSGILHRHGYYARCQPARVSVVATFVTLSSEPILVLACCWVTAMPLLLI